jgi:hypothetical protein
MVALIAMGILVLVCGALLAAVITLIAIPATRKAGWILFALLVGVPLLLLPLAGWIFLERSGPAPERVLLPRDDPRVMRQVKQQASWLGPETARDAVVQTAPATPPIIPSTPPQSQPWDEDTLINGFYISIDPPSNSSPAQHPTETPATAPVEKQPLDKALTAESARLIDALSKVLAKTILENPKTWQDLAAKARQMDKPVEKEGAVAETTAEKQPAAETPPPRLPKPDWVGRQAWFKADDTHYERDVEVDPFPTLVECENRLPAALQKAVDEYVELAYIYDKSQIVVPVKEMERYEEWRHTSQGDMLTLHVLARIDRNEVAKAYQQAQVFQAELDKKFVAEKRLERFGEYFAAGFLLLAAVWGYLKIDLATGGARRGILRAAVSVVILSIAAAVAIALRA